MKRRGVGSLFLRQVDCAGGAVGKKGLPTPFPQGFTLLEVLIAVVLSAVLMGGLWGLFGTYEALFARGQTKVENAQLVRALWEQLSRDLQSAIPDSAAGLPGQSASVRRFGLFGTRSALQVDVLQLTDSQWLFGTAGPEEPADQERPERVPELHTVQYVFEAANGSEQAPRASLTGLVRRVLDWEAPAGSPRRPGDAGRPSGRSVLRKTASLAAASADPAHLSVTDLDADDDSLLWVPEVVELEFRYYDGSGWANQWSSLARKSLPVAVEVTLTLKPTQGSARPLPVASTEGEGPSPEPLADGLPPTAGRAHRLLVYLPGTLLAQGPEASQPREERPLTLALPAVPPLPVFQPPPVPSSLTVPPSESGPGVDSLRSVLPDQWMRAGP